MANDVLETNDNQKDSPPRYLGLSAFLTSSDQDFFQIRKKERSSKRLSSNISTHTYGITSSIPVPGSSITKLKNVTLNLMYTKLKI